MQPVSGSPCQDTLGGEERIEYGPWRTSTTGDEELFQAMLDEVKDKLDCKMNYTNAQDHEPQAERINRTFKNQVRVGLHPSTFKTIPKVMIRELVVGSTEKFNLFPAKGGISDHYSPETLVTGKTLNFEKHCQYKFDEYIQAPMYNEARNDM